MLAVMRIIAGTHRSRPLVPPADQKVTRPITDRVKQAMFDRLWSLGALEASHALDLFAGTGSLGLEALSRGVERVTFVERDRDARARLESNLATLGLVPRASVLAVDVLGATWLAVVQASGPGLVFCDPPYRLWSEAKGPDRLTHTLERTATVAADGAVLVLRTDSHTPPPTLPAWDSPSTHTYGSMSLHFYRRA